MYRVTEEPGNAASPFRMGMPGIYLHLAEISDTASRETPKGTGPNTCLPNLSTGLALLLLGMLLAVFPEDDPVSADC